LISISARPWASSSQSRLSLLPSMFSYSCGRWRSASTLALSSSSACMRSSRPSSAWSSRQTISRSSERYR